jgi:hypothetical protein
MEREELLLFHGRKSMIQIVEKLYNIDTHLSIQKCCEEIEGKNDARIW